MAKFPRFKMEAAVFPSLSLSKCWLTEAPINSRGLAHTQMSHLARGPLCGIFRVGWAPLTQHLGGGAGGFHVVVPLA